MASLFLRKDGPSQTGAKGTTAAPTKEDILSTLEQFGELHGNKANKENNNNMKRRKSHDQENVDPNDPQWDMMDEVNEKPSVPSTHSHSYSMEWDRLFKRPKYLKWLRNQAIAGELRSCRYRSICWRLFLEVLSEDMSTWSQKAKQDREKYDILKNKLITNPRGSLDAANVTVNNPLSQDEESPWNKFFQDNELRLTIKQDVIRTYPKIEFFQSNQMRNLMVDILFIFAKENVEISYQQGMHELLAPLIFVLHYDHQAFLHASETETVLADNDHKSIIQDMLDPKYLEHDAYYMFCQVMDTVEPWYMAKDILPIPKKHEIFTGQPFTRPQEHIPSSVIVTKLTRIQDYLLKKFDTELHAHLDTLEIVPQIYGIRWLRLLFGREFPMQDLLMLWDAIFADSIGFDLVDYIFVAMMLYLRDLLLASDYAGCLSVLMKFPQISDAHYFIEKALWLREPKQHQQPPNYFHQVMPRIQTITPRTKHTHSHKHSGLGGFSSFSRKFSRPKTLSISSFQKNLPKSSSEPMNLQTDISPVSVPQGKRGSTASLSQVEDSMYRQQGQSTASLGRLDPSNIRSVQSSPAGYSPGGLSPDEMPELGSPSKYSSLPRSKGKTKKLSQKELELQQQVAKLQGQLNERNAMCRYCASKLDVHIGRLQEDLSRQALDVEDEVMVSLAGIKLVRDVLNGTLRFSRNIMDDEAEININDNHYDLSATPDSDEIGGLATGKHLANSDSVGKNMPSSQTKDRRRRMFYMSSGETSSTAESPESMHETASSVPAPHVMLASGTYELGDVVKARTSSMCGSYSGPQEKNVETGSQSSECTSSETNQEKNVAESPNPLYYRDWEPDFA